MQVVNAHLTDELFQVCVLRSYNVHLSLRFLQLHMHALHILANGDSIT